jgi:NitT/TauT family transport system substrate-binding protein
MKTLKTLKRIGEMNRFSGWRIALLAISGAVLLGSAPARADDKVTIRMDWVTGGYHAPFYVGVKRGYYKQQGLDVTVLPGNGSANVAQALGNGNGDLASVDGGTMMQLVSKGLPVKAVMGLFQRNPNGVVYRIDSGIKKPGDLVGKTVALSNGDAPSALLPAFAKATGLDLTKVNIVNTTPAAKNASVIAGNAQADVTFAFQGIALIEAQGVPAASLDYADYGVNVPGLAVIARLDYIKEHPDTLKKFVKATREAVEWTSKHPQEAIDIMIEMNPGQKFVAKTEVAVLEGSFKLLHSKHTEDQPIGVMSKQDWTEAQDLLAQYVGMTKIDDVDRYFTNEFAAEK